MNFKLDLNDKNKVTVMLMQALWGAISPNFRMVALSLAEPVWELLFVLEKENATDREAIDDVVGEFDGLLLGFTDGVVNYQVTAVVSAEQLPLLDPATWRTVFRRRES